MKTSHAAKLALGLALSCSATSASAATFLFDFKGVLPWDSASFTLDDETGPARTSKESFTYTDVAVTRNAVTTLETVNFYTNKAGGGFNFNTFWFDAQGPQLFKGSVKDPKFLEQEYRLTRFVTNFTIGTLTITEVVAPVISSVPEPATWAMIVLGFGMAGGFLRKTRRANVQLRFSTHGKPLAI